MAFSSKLLRNVGEPLAEEVEMLARRCLAKALYGDSWLFPVPAPGPANPKAIEMLLFLCAGAAGTPGAEGTALEGEVDAESEVLNALGLSISTKDFRL